ncbi:PIR Superfamily Protein [Plasmodium ovale curtisi]|uniref:PIR Superfamily Protein n=2 Tax=Plasmodium ovale curtisi TaxID=864141 RepID=A0A1A8WSN5_PLAOA|nr:PIR Superfamily Protein [Plasmodium ovale curtisi]
MSLTLDDLAKEKPFANDSEYERLFKELNKVCTSDDNYQNIVPCNTFDNVAKGKTFKSHLQIIFTLLRRNHVKNNIYLNNIKPLKYDSCVYYKYWFYHKLINDNIENKDINEIKKAWKMHMNNFFSSFYVPCKFHAKTLNDVKIIKVLYDHILFFNNTDDKYNLKKEIVACDFCEHLKGSLKDFVKKGKSTCTTYSPYALCMEYNDHLKTKDIVDLKELSSLSCEKNGNVSHQHNIAHLSDQFSKDRALISGESDNGMPNTDSDLGTFIDDANPDAVKSYARNVIGGVTISGIPLILYFLYKFTTLGTFLRHRIRWIRNISQKSEENVEESLLLCSKREHISMHSSQYNIEYNPAQIN